jgi:hypothetical protein
MYIHLYHGRTDPEKDMNGEWGTDGPLLGPFKSVTVTYLQQLKALIGDGSSHLFFDRYEDMIYYDGVYYGDFDIVGSPDGITAEPEAFNLLKARLHETDVKTGEE